MLHHLEPRVDFSKSSLQTQGVPDDARFMGRVYRVDGMPSMEKGSYKLTVIH